MTPQAAAAEARSWVDYIVGWIIWIAATALAVTFASSVARMWGLSVPFVPRAEFLQLVYAAGAVYLIGKR
jgi:hypothetical protein